MAGDRPAAGAEAWRVEELLARVRLPPTHADLSARSQAASASRVSRGAATDRISWWPTSRSGPDVSVQAQILHLLADLRFASAALLFISHDLAVGAASATVVVMYLGGVVGKARRPGLADPRHPMRALLSAAPSLVRRGGGRILWRVTAQSLRPPLGLRDPHPLPCHADAPPRAGHQRIRRRTQGRLPAPSTIASPAITTPRESPSPY